MPIRTALPPDIPTMASTAASAFAHDSLYAHFLHPHLAAFPRDWLYMWTRRFRASIASSTCACLVAVDESGRVVGVAEWERWEEAGRVKKRLELGGWGLRSAYVAAWNWASTLLWPDRSADPAQAHALEANFPLIAPTWGGERARTWFLSMLCVAPEWQGRGFGAELVDWGVRRAEREGVSASLISARGKDGFYGRLGFVEVGRADVGPLEGVGGGAIMFRDGGRAGE